ncbi:MAG: hypothetical protein KDJ35_03445 [Alphaproteobacteria bacterium]|nr:hypothetical protein [Alphaproteobacteria bacterium]
MSSVMQVNSVDGTKNDSAKAEMARILTRDGFKKSEAGKGWDYSLWLVQTGNTSYGFTPQGERLDYEAA